MSWAFDLGRIYGIRIRIHYLFVLFVGFLVLREGMLDVERNTFFAPILLVFLLLLFGFVLLHELGHSLMAIRFGIPVKDITLWPLGGIARLGRIPENPTVELAIAVAGPAVNIAIAIALLPFLLTFVPDFWENAFKFPSTSVLSYCFVVNLFMAGFNFIPAFPMDGGRVLRSVLGYRMSFVDATRLAVKVGRFFAFGFILYGILKAMPMLALIGIFIMILGAQEERAVRWRSFFQRMRKSGGPILDEEGNPIEGLSMDSDLAMREALAKGDLETFRHLLTTRLAEESRRRGHPPPDTPVEPDVPKRTPTDSRDEGDVVEGEVIDHDPPPETRRDDGNDG